MKYETITQLPWLPVMKKEDILKLNDSIELKNNSYRTFIHDLRNLLLPIMSYSELLLHQTTPKASSKEYLTKILKATHKAHLLINQFSHPESYQKSWIDVSKIVQDVVFLLEGHPNQKKLTFYTCIEENLPIIWASDIDIYRVVFNLCNNACQAMIEQGDTLEIFLKIAPNDFLLLQITDNGKGIASEHMEQIFQPLFSTGNSMHNKGLGLYIVQQIVEEHGGHIKVTSQLGQGSRFDVYLPFSPV